MSDYPCMHAGMEEVWRHCRVLCCMAVHGHAGRRDHKRRRDEVRHGGKDVIAHHAGVCVSGTWRGVLHAAACAMACVICSQR